MADISATLRAWSTTAASNQPQGGTTIGAGLDDNLRQIQTVVRQFLASQGTNMASAATLDLATADGYYVSVTGVTTITGLGTEAAGIHYLLEFAGILTFTHNATSLILPGAADITTAVGDLALMVSEGSGNWRCAFYTRANGTPVSGAVLMTEQASTSGTSIDFTSIPSWATQITITFEGVSTNGTSQIIVQLGDAGGFETSGYLGASVAVTDASTPAGTNFTTGFGIQGASAAIVRHGSMTLTLKDAANFTWTSTHSVARSDAAGAAVGGGSKSTSAALTQVRITTVNGSDAFDAGSINVIYR